MEYFPVRLYLMPASDYCTIWLLNCLFLGHILKNYINVYKFLINSYTQRERERKRERERIYIYTVTKHKFMYL